MMKSQTIAMGTLMLLLVGLGSRPAYADSKDEFKGGCESGHGSFVENVDNVQCNTSGGLTITCDKEITSCSVSSVVVPTKRGTTIVGALQGYFTGKLKVELPPDQKIKNANSARE